MQTLFQKTLLETALQHFIADIARRGTNKKYHLFFPNIVVFFTLQYGQLSWMAVIAQHENIVNMMIGWPKVR